MVPTKIKQWYLQPYCWVYAAQGLIGLFFLGATIYKVSNYFVIRDESLRTEFNYWIELRLPAQWYKALILWLFTLPMSERILTTIVIACQAIGGFFLLINYRTRVAGVILLFIQLNIFLGTFHHLGFTEFVGMSVWIALYYALRPPDLLSWKGQSWQLLTLLFTGICVLFLINRYRAGDPWAANAGWQLEHFERDIMSTHIQWKQFVLHFFSGTYGLWLWAGVWWLQLLLTTLLLTPMRLPAGAALLVLAVLRAFTWTNTVTSQGVLTVLFIFIWVAQQQYLEAKMHQEKPVARKNILEHLVWFFLPSTK